MLIRIGDSQNESSDVVDLLLACHERIRFFIDLAIRLADATDASHEEIRAAAARVVRYFSESLPLHVADEEESILPRLWGRDPVLDRALGAMRTEHDVHEPRLEVLLKICRALQTAPERLLEVSDELRRVSSALADDFKVHLEQEETVVLPAIRSLLSDRDRDVMLQELRDRRSA